MLRSHAARCRGRSVYSQAGGLEFEDLVAHVGQRGEGKVPRTCGIGRGCQVEFAYGGTEKCRRNGKPWHRH